MRWLNWTTLILLILWTTITLHQTAIPHGYFHWTECIFHHNFQFYSNGHQGSLSGALLVYPAVTQKALVQWDLQRACLTPRYTSPSEKTLKLFIAKTEKLNFTFLCCLRPKCWYCFSSLKIKISKLGHRDEWVKPSCVELSVAVVGMEIHRLWHTHVVHLKCE